MNTPTLEEKLNNLINEISQKFDKNSKVCNSILAKFANKTDPKEVSLVSTSTDQSNKHLFSVMSSFLNEEKEKSKCNLNLIVYNALESTDEQGLVRKQHDIDFVTGALQQYLGITTKIEKAFRLGKCGEKPRLMKVIVASEQDKATILRRCSKFRNTDNPKDVQKLYITPDLTPEEQKINRKLCEELREKNRDGKLCYIKNGQIVKRPTAQEQKRAVTSPNRSQADQLS